MRKTYIKKSESGKTLVYQNDHGKKRILGVHKTMDGPFGALTHVEVIKKQRKKTKQDYGQDTVGKG